MEHFTFTDRAKKTTLGLILIGVVTLIYGILDSNVSSERLWVNALINGWFFFGIGIIGTFFVAVNLAAQSAWVVTTKRVFEAISMFLPMGALLLILVFVGSIMHWNHIYHWMDPEAAAHDALIAGKAPYLNIPFWSLRAIIFLGVWILFTLKLRKRSLAEDGNPELSIKNYSSNRGIAAGFLVFFGFTSVVASWDWLMSIDVHWFSTLYGWYVFSGIWISGMVMAYLLIHWLMSKGYFQKDVNASHIHDLGKWIFAISFLWTYLFFSQFMLIWYANIPEEVAYYVIRINEYPVTFWSMVMINFVIPMLLLMSKTAKRNRKLLTIVGIIIFFGHWADVYFLIVPGVLKENGTFGIIEIGFLLGYLGIFLFIVLRQLAKAQLVPVSNVLYDESVHHHIN